MTESEAASSMEEYKRFPRAVLQEVYDQFHVFSSAEKFLQSPTMLFQGVTNDLTLRTRRWLVNKYVERACIYAYDIASTGEYIGCVCGGGSAHPLIFLPYQS